MKPQRPITASEFFANVADLLQKGTFTWSCFEDVFAAVNTLRQLSAQEKHREKAAKHTEDTPSADPATEVPAAEVPAEAQA